MSGIPAAPMPTISTMNDGLEYSAPLPLHRAVAAQLLEKIKDQQAVINGYQEREIQELGQRFGGIQLAGQFPPGQAWNNLVEYVLQQQQQQQQVAAEEEEEKEGGDENELPQMADHQQQQPQPQELEEGYDELPEEQKQHNNSTDFEFLSRRKKTSRRRQSKKAGYYANCTCTFNATTSMPAVEKSTYVFPVVYFISLVLLFLLISCALCGILISRRRGPKSKDYNAGKAKIMVTSLGAKGFCTDFYDKSEADYH